jgi:hypothetical protein
MVVIGHQHIAVDPGPVLLNHQPKQLRKETRSILSVCKCLIFALAASTDPDASETRHPA